MRLSLGMGVIDPCCLIKECADNLVTAETQAGLYICSVEGSKYLLDIFFFYQKEHFFIDPRWKPCSIQAEPKSLVHSNCKMKGILIIINIPFIFHSFLKFV